MTKYVLEVWSVRRLRVRAWRRGLMQPIWQGVSSIRPLQFSNHDDEICFGSSECTSLSGLASRTYAADMASYESHLSPPASISQQSSTRG